MRGKSKYWERAREGSSLPCHTESPPSADTGDSLTPQPKGLIVEVKNQWPSVITILEEQDTGQAPMPLFPGSSHTRTAQSCSLYHLAMAV